MEEVVGLAGGLDQLPAGAARVQDGHVRVAAPAEFVDADGVRLAGAAWKQR